MKKIICYLDESTNTVYQDESKLWLLGSVDITGNTPIVTVEENNSNVNILELVKAGLSAEDIIKMKHGGVI